MEIPEVDAAINPTWFIFTTKKLPNLAASL